MVVEAISISGETEEKFLIDDPMFRNQPYFESRQRAYGKAGRMFAELVEDAESVDFEPEEKQILERLFVVMSVVDFMVDNLKMEKSEVESIVRNGDERTPSLNKALSELRAQIEKHGDYNEFLKNAFRAMSYSGRDTLKARHQEAMYLGKALAVAVQKDSEKKSHLTKVMGHLTSLGNFADDIMDHRHDGKTASWALERGRAGVREMLRLHRTSEAAHKYIAGAVLTALTLYGRRIIPNVFRNDA